MTMQRKRRQGLTLLLRILLSTRDSHAACVNRRVQHACSGGVPYCQRADSGVEIFPTPEKGGWGLRAKKSYNKGDVVVEYLGESLEYEAVAPRREQQQREGRQNYLVVLCENISTKDYGKKQLHTCVDASSRGNAARFANHSCEPNMRPMPVRTGRCSPRLIFFAARAIAAGEELTISYGSCGEPRGEAGAAGARGAGVAGGAGEGRKACLCGAPTCGGFLPFDLDFL